MKKAAQPQLKKQGEDGHVVSIEVLNLKETQKIKAKIETKGHIDIKIGLEYFTIHGGNNKNKKLSISKKLKKWFLRTLLVLSEIATIIGAYPCLHNWLYHLS